MGLFRASVLLLTFCLFCYFVEEGQSLSYSQLCPRNSYKSWKGDTPFCVCTSASQVPNGDETQCVTAKTKGEPCDFSEKPCAQILDCINGICACKEPGTWDEYGAKLCYNQEFCEAQGQFFYDDVAKKCVSNIGSEINRKYISINYTCPQNSDIQFVKGDTVIVKCECVSGFTSAEDSRSCLVAKYKGDECSIGDYSCDAKANLQCLSEGSGYVCTCNLDEGFVWNSKVPKCVIKVYEKCDDSKKEHKCTPGAICEYGFCDCDYSKELARSRDEDGFCYKRYGSECQGGGDCSPEYACIDGTCACPEPMFQKYDDDLEIQQCRTLARSPCSSLRTSFCTEHAKCKDGYCECLPGFWNNLNGACEEFKPYGSNCTRGPCDAAKGIACIDGVCACISSTLKYVEGKGCMAGLASPCGTIAPSGKCAEDSQGECAGYVVQCEDSTTCKPLSDEPACSLRGKNIPKKCVPLSG